MVCFLKQKTKGITLIEMLVVISVVMILSAVIFANYRTGEKQFAFQRTASKLAQDFRVVQGMAGQEWEECKIGENYHEDYKFGYGLFFDEINPKEYIIFADCRGNREYDPDIDKIVQRIELERGVAIESFSPKISNRMNVVSVPPKPSIYINTEKTGQAEVTLKIEGTDQSKKIIVNTIGRVEIIN